MTKGQSRMESLAEVLTNTAVGAAGNWLIVCGTVVLIKNPALAATVVVALSTVWSIGRGYLNRRYFEGRTQRSPLTQGDSRHE